MYGCSFRVSNFNVGSERFLGKATVSEIIWNLDPYSACLTALLSGVKQIQSLSDQVRGSFQKKLKLSLGRRLGTWNTIMTPQKIKVNFLVCTETSNESRRVLLCGTKKSAAAEEKKGAESEVPVASTTPGSQHAKGVANLCTRQMQTSRTEIMQAFPEC